MIKKYNDWLNESYGGPPSDEESFMEKYEALAIKFEKKMSINSTDFFDKIQALNLEDEIKSTGAIKTNYALQALAIYHIYNADVTP